MFSQVKLSLHCSNKVSAHFILFVSWSNLVCLKVMATLFILLFKKAQIEESQIVISIKIQHGHSSSLEVGRGRTSLRMTGIYKYLLLNIFVDKANTCV